MPAVLLNEEVGEIEAVLHTHPTITEIAILPVPEDDVIDNRLRRVSVAMKLGVDWRRVHVYERTNADVIEVKQERFDYERPEEGH